MVTGSLALDVVAWSLMMAQDADKWAEFRPDVIGSVAIGHDEGAYTMVMYFTSETAAREGERKELPPELQAQKKRRCTHRPGILSEPVASQTAAVAAE